MHNQRKTWGLIKAVLVVGTMAAGTVQPSQAQTSTSAAAANCDAVSLNTYTNPLNVSIADPFVLQAGDTYYMYGTTDYGPRGFQVFTSPDLVRWTLAGQCYSPNRNSWGTHSFWAPEVIAKDGAYYLHYTCFSAEERKRNICVARADSPLGPFEDYAGPLYPERSIIDSHVYYDEDSGKYYIYASPENEAPSRILGSELSTDFKRLLTSPTITLKSDYGWEDLWIEGPIIEKHEDTLYMLYSGGAFWEADYALGYATATSPLGPWTKSPTNPFLKKRRGVVEGAGHNGLARSPDGSELFLVYHRHASPSSIKRVAALDRLVFEKVTSGPDVLRAPGAPSSEPQPIPSGAASIKLAKSDDFSPNGLDLSHWQIYANAAKNWSVEDGALVIRAGNDDFWRSHDDGENVFLQQLASADCDYAIETKVDMRAERINEQTFLVLWYDPDNYVMLAASHQEEPRFVTMIESNGKANASLAPNTLGWPIWLRMEKRGDSVKVLASKDGKTWEPTGEDVDVSGMNLRYVGLGAWSPGTGRRLPARFEYFKVERLED